MSSLVNALRILDLLGRDRPVLRVGEVCRSLDLPKSSVSRLLRTMAEHGMLDRAEDGSYMARPGSVTVAELYGERHLVLPAIRTALGGLVDDFGFTGFVSALSGREIVLLHVLQGARPLRYVREVGTRLPACETAMGKVLLARLPDETVADRMVGAGNVNIERLLGELDQTRRRGFILAGSVLTPGASTLAAAIADPRSGEPLALALAYADSAVPQALRARMTTALLRCTRRLMAPSAHALGR